MQTQTTQPQVVTEVPESGWEISSGINNPTNKQYQRNVLGKTSIFNVFGDMFDKLGEFIFMLMSKLFNFMGVDLDKEKRAGDISRSELNFYEKDLEFNRGRYKLMDESKRTFDQNSIDNMPEYGSKDPSKEYLSYTHYATALYKFGENKEVEPALRQNFLKMFKLCIDQIKHNDKEPIKSLPFAEWMTSDAYKNSFKDIVEKDNLFVGLSDQDKEKLVKARYLTKDKRDELFKDNPSLEEKFKLIQQTALAIAGTDRMAILQATESGIKSLYVGDVRSSNSGQLGALQLTITTAFEKAGRVYDDRTIEKEGINLIEKYNLKRPMTQEEVGRLISSVAGNQVFYRQLLEPSKTLTTMINDCKGDADFRRLMGKLQMIYGDEMRYIDISQRILNDKTVIAINKVGGLDNFYNTMMNGTREEKGRMALAMINNVKQLDEKGNIIKVTPEQLLYRINEELTNDELQKLSRMKMTDEVRYDLIGRWIEKDPRRIFSFGAYSQYHATPEQTKLLNGANSLSVYGDDIKTANATRLERQGEGLVAVTENIDVKKLKEESYLAQADKSLSKGNILLTISQNEFKDKHLEEGKTIRGNFYAAKLNLINDKSPAFNDLVKIIKSNPDEEIKYAPAELIQVLKENVGKELSFKELMVKAEENREKYIKSILEKGFSDNPITAKAFLDHIKSDDRKYLAIMDFANKNPELKSYLKALEKEPNTILEAGTSLESLRKDSIEVKDLLASGKPINEIRATRLIERGIEAEKQANAEQRGGGNFMQTVVVKDDNRKFDKLKDHYLDFVKGWSKDEVNYLKENDGLAKALLILTYGKERATAYGLNYYQIEEAFLKECIDRKLFVGSEQEALATAKDFIWNLQEQREKYKIRDDEPLEKMIEEAVEDTYLRGGDKKNVKKEMTAQMASFLIQQGFLTSRNFETPIGSFVFGNWDEMQEIRVKMREGRSVALSDYGQDLNKYSKPDYDYYLAQNQERIHPKEVIAQAGIDRDKIDQLRADNSQEKAKGEVSRGISL